MSGYRYPDKDDRLTARFIDREEPYEGYWENSESEALSQAEKFVSGSDAHLLDIGCGEGRLFDRFEEYASSIVGLEPDTERKKLALQEAEGIDAEVDVRSQKFMEEDFDTAFDIVICSHVLQHIETSIISDFIDYLHHCLAEEGLLILTASHPTHKSDAFLKTYFEEGRLEEEKVSEQDFNSLVTNDENILPVHLFTVQNLEDLLEDFDLKTVRVFHELHSVTFLDSIIFRDKWINLPLLKKRTGRDVMIVAQKE